MLFSASGDNFEEAAAVYSANYDMPRVVITPTRQPFHWSHSAVGDDVMTLRKNVMIARIDSSFSSGDDFVVGLALSGEASYRLGRSVFMPPLLKPLIMPHGRHPRHATAENMRLSLVHIDRRFVESVAEELDDADFGTFEVFAPITDRSLRIWSRTVNLVASVVMNDTKQVPTLLSREIARLIAVTMLTIFPYQKVAHGLRPLGVEPVSVRLANDFIHDNAHLPISSADVATAAGLSVRSLQTAFRRYRETTPNALLQSVRLDRAYAELASTDQAVNSVSAVARRWGFVHLGRFSASYYKRFGELPSETLCS